ncbi:hypothetical protein ACWCXX_25000 [Streptomyces sp. NPDC001732]
MTTDKHQRFMAMPIQQPDDVPTLTPLSWQAERLANAGERLFANLLPANHPHPVERGTADDALAQLALGEAIRRTIENHRPGDIHQALTLGATWSEVATALDISPDEARDLLRDWSDGQHHLYAGDQERGEERPLGFSPARHAEVTALCERGDNEREGALTEGTGL